MISNLLNRYKDNQVKDATDFINLLQREGSFRYISDLIDIFGNRVTYKGRPLSFYTKLWADAAFISAPQTSGKVSWVNYHKQAFNAKKSASGLKDFLGQCVMDERSHHFFSLAIAKSQTQLLVKEALVLPEEVEKEPYSPQRTKKIEELVYKAHQADHQQILKDPGLSKEFKEERPEVNKKPEVSQFSNTRFKESVFNFRTKVAKLTIPSFAKDWGVSALIFTKKQINRFPSQIIGGVAGATAAAAAFVPLGPLGPLGILTGALGGGLIAKRLGQSLLTNNSQSAFSSNGRQTNQENISTPPSSPESIPNQSPQYSPSSSPQNSPPNPKSKEGDNLGQIVSGASSLIRIGPIVIGFVIGLSAIFIFLFFFDDEGGGGFLSSIGQPSTGQAASLTPTNKNIGSCQFTRSGVSAPYKSSLLLNWISDRAANLGVPPAIIASIARHESPALTTNGDDNNDAIRYNNYCNPGSAFCEQSGSLLHSGACTEEEKNNGARTGTAMGLMQVVDIYNPGVDLCNIKTNIETGIQIFKDKLTGATTDEQSVKTAVCRYFGVDSATCPYGGGDYAQEVWNDYQSCKSSSIYVASCPVPNGKISYPSYSQGGHCSSDYGYSCPCSEAGDGRRANAVDVPTNGQQVFLPQINGQTVLWQLKQIYPVDSEEGGGNGNLFQAQIGSDTWTLDILHLGTSNQVVTGGQYSSGTAIGYAYNKLNDKGEVIDDHIHFSIGKNINEPISLINSPPSGFVCSKNWIPADSLCQ